MSFVLLSYIDLHSQLIISKPVTLIDHTQGLNGLFNYYIFKDSRGLVWICSISGLYQFDGKRLKVYSPDPEDQNNANPQHIHSFFSEDAEGNIWFGTWRGISCYIRKTEQFVSHLLPDANPDSRFMACGFDSLGQLWFHHNSGIYTMDTKTSVMKRHFDVQARYTNAELQLDEKGNVRSVFAYHRFKNLGGMYLYKVDKSGNWHSISLFTKLEETIAVSDVQVMTDTTFLIAATNGLYEYNVASGVLQLFLPEGITGDWAVHSITPYQDSLFLIATETHGYYTFSEATKTFTGRFQIEYRGEVLHDLPVSMYTDPDGAVWIHLTERGVAFFNPRNQVSNYYPIQITHQGKQIPLTVQGLINVDNQTVLVTTRSYGGYFITSSGNKLDQILPCTDCPSDFSSTIKDANGGIWLNSLGNLYRLNPDRKFIHVPGNPDTRLGFTFCELPDGRIINVSLGTLLISEKENTNRLSFSKIQSIDTNYSYTHIAILPDGKLYASAIKKRNAEGVHLHVFDPVDHFKLVRSVPVPWGIRCFERIPGSDEILIGTTQGPYYYNTSNGIFRQVEFAPCGNESIWKIWPVAEQTYFMCGDKCFSTIDLKHKESRTYGNEHGLGNEGTTWYAYLLHSSGKIWLGHSTGISIVDPDDLDVPELIPKVNISVIRVNYKEYDPGPDKNHQVTNPNEIHSIRLPHTQNTLSFDFAALSYAGIDANEYEYRMTGLEEDWVEGGNQGFARYVNLSAGDYAFEVRVKNQPKSVHVVDINIIPPFYARAWFLTIVGASLFVLIYQLMQFREQRKRRVLQLQYEKQLAIEHERLRISNNLHDDLGSGLSALNLRAQVIAEQTGDSGTRDLVNQLAEHTRKLVGQIRETIWTINSQHDTVDSLVTRLHQYTIEYFESSEIDCKVQLMPDQILTIIPGDHRREIYLAFKEALHNIVKHSRATEVNVKMELTDAKHLVISIHDNGVGFDSKTKNSGQGIQSMQSRMKGIGGDLQITSGSHGTNIVFDYPV